MDEVERMVFDVFQARIRIAEKAIRIEKAKIKSHDCGFFCFFSCRRKMLERRVLKNEKSIKKFREARKNMLKGDYGLAIELLDCISRRKSKKNSLVIKLEHPIKAEDVINRFNSTVRRLSQARDYLAKTASLEQPS